jgi:hypothetical protein
MIWAGRACGLASQVTGPHAIRILPMVLHEELDVLINC